MIKSDFYVNEFDSLFYLVHVSFWLSALSHTMILKDHDQRMALLAFPVYNNATNELLFYRLSIFRYPVIAAPM